MYEIRHLWPKYAQRVLLQRSRGSSSPAEPGTTAIAILQGVAQEPWLWSRCSTSACWQHYSLGQSRRRSPHCNFWNWSSRSRVCTVVWHRYYQWRRRINRSWATGVSEGQTVPYYCIVHPYMTSQYYIAAKEQGGGQTQGGGGANQTGETTAGGAGGGGGATAGGSTINILEALQYKAVLIMTQMSWQQAQALRSQWSIKTQFCTSTSGTGPQDPESAQLSLIQSLINGGESATLSLAQVTPGQYDYYCMVHPYMTGKINVTVRDN